MTATFYVDHSSRPCANRHTFQWNTRHYGGRFAASNRFPLGSRVALTSRSGRRVIVTIADRVGHGTDLDCCPQAMRVLVGPRYKIIGRLTVTVKLEHGHKEKRHHAEH